MEPKINEIAQRIQALREIMDFSQEEMAQAAGVSLEEYQTLEQGNNDFSFTFLYRCAEKFGVDMIELLTGENPHLKSYAVVRKGHGLPIKRREGFTYHHLAPNFSEKLCEPFLVTAPYSKEAQERPISLNRHDGQEYDYILKGSLKFQTDNHVEILYAGDSVLYDSGHPHGMIATGGEDCEFLAVILKEPMKE